MCNELATKFIRPLQNNLQLPPHLFYKKILLKKLRYFEEPITKPNVCSMSLALRYSKHV